MVYLFPLSYPYKVGQEDTFLSTEISLLNKNFSELIIFPTLIGKEMFKINQTIFINRQLGKYLANNRFRFNLVLKTSFYRLFFAEIYNKPLILLQYSKIKQLIGFILNTIQTEIWIKTEFIKNFDLERNKKIILYTFWFTHLTTALCNVFKTNKHIKVITRAHGIDLFTERNKNYIPLREYTINLLDKFFFVSDYGKDYATKLYPKYKNKYRSSPLGVVNHGYINSLSNNENIEYHFVSCSNVDVNKRVSLILKSLYLLATKHPEKKIRWTHFGHGPLFQDLKKEITNYKNANLIVKLKGFQANKYIFNYYRHKSINSFITTTSSEGGRPISVQEALSFGIPVIATKVGGIPELIDEKNGFLLPDNPEINEITNALNMVITNSEKWNMKRSFCLKTWNEKCDSVKLANNFINELKNL